MASMAIAHQVYALVRQRPGITYDELRRAIGTDVNQALRRLTQLGYIRRDYSKGYLGYYPVRRPTE